MGQRGEVMGKDEGKKGKEKEWGKRRSGRREEKKNEGEGRVIGELERGWWKIVTKKMPWIVQKEAGGKQEEGGMEQKENREGQEEIKAKKNGKEALFCGEQFTGLTQGKVRECRMGKRIGKGRK